MPNFDNDAALEAFMLTTLQIIVNEVSEQMLEKLQDLIQSEVYDDFPAVYERRGMNGGLLGSFEKSDATIFGKEILSLIDQNIMGMDIEPENYVHGSYEWHTDDIRDLLTEIVTEGKSGKRFGGGFWTRPRDFWKPFIELVENGTCDKLLVRSARKHGLILQKIY
jgi:hypothetical protein